MTALERRQALVAGKYGETLQEIESRLDRVLRGLFVDRDGFVRGGISQGDLLPHRDEDLREYAVEELFTANAGMPRKWKRIVMNYEEADMATGDYLMGLCHKWAVTRDPAVREQARGTFRAIRTLCDNAAEQNPYGRGWLPKPYGGIREVGEVFECSVDQYAKIAQGLDLYCREVATAAERKVGEALLVSFADWWADHWYTANYFGNCCWWWRANFPHAESFFLYIVALAEALTGEKRYGSEYRKLLAFREALMNVPRIETNACNLTIENLARVQELKPGQRKLCRESQWACWEWSVAHTRPEGFQVQGRPGQELRVNNVGRVACSGATLAAWHPRQREIAAWCRELLAKANCREMFLHLHPSTGKLPRMFELERDDLSGHHHASWLHAYWKLRRLEG